MELLPGASTMPYWDTITQYVYKTHLHTQTYTAQAGVVIRQVIV